MKLQEVKPNTDKSAQRQCFDAKRFIILNRAYPFSVDKFEILYCIRRTS